MSSPYDDTCAFCDQYPANECPVCGILVCEDCSVDGLCERCESDEEEALGY